MRTTIKIAISLLPSKYRKHTTVYLLIDDTLQQKFGEKLELAKILIRTVMPQLNKF